MTNPLKRHTDVVVLLICFGFWFLLFLTSGSLFSGFHFTDDHDIVAIHYHLATKGMRLAEVIWKWLQEDHATGRFRVFYFIHRIVQTSFLGIQFPLWATYTGILAGLTTFLFFVFARLLKFSVLPAFVFAFLTTLGSQSAVWWQLGPAETIGTFLLAISLVFLALSASSSQFQLIFEVLAVGFAVLMSLSKENYILMLPTIGFLKVWLNQQKGGSWGIAFKQSIPTLVILSLVFVFEILFVKYKVGTTPEIGYAGLDGFDLSSIWAASLSLGVHGDWWIIPVGLILLLVLQLINQHESTASFRHKLWEASRQVSKTIYIPLFLFLLISIPQVIIYAKSGIVQRYLFPGILAYSLLIAWIFQELHQHSKDLSRIILILIVMTLSFKLHAAWNTAHGFALEGKSTNRLLNEIITNVAPDEPILIVTNPLVYYEWNYSIKKYLNYVGGRENLYVSTFEQRDVNDFGKKLRRFYGGKTLATLADRSTIRCVVVFPSLNQAFLQNSSSWFIPHLYRESTFGNFNRNLNPNSFINLYCKNP